METELEEFKLSTSQTSRALDSMAVMLNKHGKGTVYFGVRDNEEVVGQDIDNKTLRKLSDEITSRIKPQIIPVIEIVEFGDKQVIPVSSEGSSLELKGLRC